MIDPQKVKSILSRHLLFEGFNFIVDLDKSTGSWLVDQRIGDRYLDFFQCLPPGQSVLITLNSWQPLGSLAKPPCRSPLTQMYIPLPWWNLRTRFRNSACPIIISPMHFFLEKSGSPVMLPPLRT